MGVLGLVEIAKSVCGCALGLVEIARSGCVGGGRDHRVGVLRLAEISLSGCVGAGRNNTKWVRWGW